MKKTILCVIYGLLIAITYADESSREINPNLVDPNQGANQTIPELINNYDELNRFRQQLPEQLEKAKAAFSEGPTGKNAIIAQKTANQNHESFNAAPYQCTIISPCEAIVHTENKAEYYSPNTWHESRVRCYVNGWD